MEHPNFIPLTDEESRQNVWIRAANIVALIVGGGATSVWLDGGNRFRVMEPPGKILTIIDPVE